MILRSFHGSQLHVGEEVLDVTRGLPVDGGLALQLPFQLQHVVDFEPRDGRGELDLACLDGCRGGALVVDDH